MKLLFINPVTPPEVFKVQLSLGVAYLSAVLKKGGHETALLCSHKFNPKEISSKIDSFKPDIITISTVSDQFNLTKKIIEFIHQKYKLPIILGGTHPTVAPEESINIKGVTGLCRGEGEYALLEFADLYEKGEDYSKVKNFWFK